MRSGSTAKARPDKTDSERFAISARGLRKSWPGGVDAVKGVDFDVHPGEVFGLLGPNGAGKSTTIGMLITSVAPTAGRALVHGIDVSRRPLAVRSLAAVVFQDPAVDRALTGGQNLEFHARLWGVPRGEAVARARQRAHEFDLADIIDRPVATYSGGERRRLEIARALLSQPRLLFLDEPTVGLDPRIRFELLDKIAGLGGQSQLTVMLTTHYLDEAERLCHRVAIIHEGTIVALDAPANLLAGVGPEVLQLRVERDPEAAMAALQQAKLAGRDAFAVGATITVPVHDRPAAEVAAEASRLGLAATSMSTRQPTLDDVYLRLTGKTLAV
jgi:ABC-2 type transport system ATP-binding protein